MDSPGGFPNFDYAFQPNPVTVSPSRIQATLQSTRAQVTFTEPIHPAFKLQQAGAGTIAKRRAEAVEEAIEEAAAYAARENHFTRYHEWYYAEHLEVLMFREVDYQRAASYLGGAPEQEVSPNAATF